MWWKNVFESGFNVLRFILFYVVIVLINFLYIKDGLFTDIENKSLVLFYEIFFL